MRPALQQKLTEDERDSVRGVKRRILGMIQERDSLPPGSLRDFVEPSEMWATECRYFSYLYGLPDEYYAQYRLHTYHIDGDWYHPYFISTPEEYRRKTNYDFLVQNIPGEYRLSAPDALGEFGFVIDGRIINGGVLKSQHIVNALYREGLLTTLRKNPRNTILEIGAGYGALAYHLKRVLPNTTYVIIDIPEVLFFSAMHLTLAPPKAKVHLYDPEDPQAIPGDSDFVLLPNYRLSALERHTFHLALNVSSFQEMRQEQLRTYLDFLRSRCDLLYSWNRDLQPRNSELRNVTDLLREQLVLKELFPAYPKFLSRMWRAPARRILTALGYPFPWYPYREYVCKPRPTLKA